MVILFITYYNKVKLLPLLMSYYNKTMKFEEFHQRKLGIRISTYIIKTKRIISAHSTYIISSRVLLLSICLSIAESTEVTLEKDIEYFLS